MAGKKLDLAPKGIDPNDIHAAHSAIKYAVKCYEELADVCEGYISNIPGFVNIKLPHSPLSLGDLVLLRTYNFESASHVAGFYASELLFGQGSAHQSCSTHLFLVRGLVNRVRLLLSGDAKWPSFEQCIRHLRSYISTPSSRKTPRIEELCSAWMSRVRWDTSLSAPLAKEIVGYEWDTYEDSLGLDREYTCALILQRPNARLHASVCYTLQDLSEDVRAYDKRSNTPIIDGVIHFRGPLKSQIVTKRRLGQSPTVFQRLPLYRQLEGYVNAKYGELNTETLLRIRGELCLACPCDSITANNMPLGKVIDILLTQRGHPQSRGKGGGRTVKEEIVNWRFNLREEVDKAYQALGQENLKLAVEHIAETKPSILEYPRGSKRLNLLRVRSELQNHAKYLKSPARQNEKTKRKN